MIYPRINSGPMTRLNKYVAMRKQVKIQKPACWQSFTIFVNSVLENNEEFYLIVEEAPFSLSLGSTEG